MSFETVAIEMHLHPELEDYRRQLDSVRDEVQDLAATLSDAQARWRPSPERWSVADCVEHLSLTTEQFLPGLEARIDTAQRRRDPTQPVPQTFRRGLVGRFLPRMMEPPVKRRLRAPRGYRPAADLAGGRGAAEIFTRFVGLQQALVLQLRRSQGLDLGRVKLISPVTRLLRLNLGDWYAFLAAHERRHLWQARQVMKEAGFPGV